MEGQDHGLREKTEATPLVASREPEGLCLGRVRSRRSAVLLTLVLLSSSFVYREMAKVLHRATQCTAHTPCTFPSAHC